VVLIAIILLGRLLFTQAITLGSGVDDKEEYSQTVKAAYASLFSFLAFGAVYANLNYILAVQIGGLTFEEYKDMGIFTGKILSTIGFGPLKWIVLALAAVGFFRVCTKTSDLGMLHSPKQQEKKKAEAPQSAISSYFAQVLGISVSPAENTVEANRCALKEYFLPILNNDEEKAGKLSEVTLNIASLEISDPREVLGALVEDSGLSVEEITKCFPKLKPGSE